MPNSAIKNVIFDIGNVMVRWSPLEIARLVYPEHPEPQQLLPSLFRRDVWRPLNIGTMTIEQAKQIYVDHGFSADDAQRLFYYVEQTLIPLYGSLNFLKRIKQAGYGVYALTDNIREIMVFLEDKYEFIPLFDGVICSAEVGEMKPDPVIYQALFDQFQLNPSECVFLDDMPHNVEGAQAVGMSAIQFFSVNQAERELNALGLTF